MRHLGWLIGLLCCVGATFQAETDGKYRVFIGPDKTTDWVDVCCSYNESFELEYADYTPIETIAITKEKGYLYYDIRKKYSQWWLYGTEHTTNDWTSRLKEFTK